VLVTYLVSKAADRWDGSSQVRLKADATQFVRGVRL
jgi:hypothetical protein